MERMELELLILDIIHKMERRLIDAEEYQTELVAIENESGLTFQEMSPIVSKFVRAEQERNRLRIMQEKNTREFNPSFYEESVLEGGNGIRKGIYDSFTY